MTTNHHITRSTMITEIEYDEAEKLLRLKFAKGGWYEYSDVSKDIYNELLGAESIGKYFLAKIKDHYKTERV